MKLKLIALIGETLEAVVDYIGLRNVIILVIAFGLCVAIFAPLIISALVSPS